MLNRIRQSSLEQPLAPVKTAEAAPLAALGIVNDISRPESQGRTAQIARDLIGQKPMRLLAVLAQHAHKALADDDSHARRDEVAFNAHVAEAG